MPALIVASAVGLGVLAGIDVPDPEPTTTAATVTHYTASQRPQGRITRFLVRKPVHLVVVKPKPVPKPKATPKPKPTVSSVPRNAPSPTPPPVVNVSGWLGQMRSCIATKESTNNPKAVDPTGTYFGMYQFLPSTWHAVTGLSGVASDYSTAVQTAAFFKLFAGGAGRHQWSTYPACRAIYGGPA
jgi:outer membrane biosynthesis protein TonB